MVRRGVLFVSVLAMIAALLFTATMFPQQGTVQAQEYETGNVIFIHPDGTALNHWTNARIYWEGPDGFLEWDLLPEMAAYRGHMSDRLTGTSNGGATVHAFGYKVQGPGSFGQDGGGEDARPILSLSGYAGSIMREAANAGHPIGIVNDGDLPEPGTGVFLAEVADRGEASEIARQFLDGRPGFEGETPPEIMLGGGERFFLPEGTPRCERAEAITPECAVHIDPVNGRGPARTDGRNLIQEAIDDGYVVVRTREQFADLWAEIQADPDYTPKVLGLFAADDIFNDEPEEVLLELGLIDETVAADDKEGQLVVWGDLPGTLGYNPPTPAEMNTMALELLERHSQADEKSFMLVTEVESTDNLGNNNNAVGTLRALKRADDLIGVARAFQEEVPDTMIITAADSDAGGMQVVAPPPTDDDGNVTAVPGNTVDGEPVPYPLDGIEGPASPPFIAAADAFGQELPFAITWSGLPDVAGGILSRAQGPNAELLREIFFDRFDSTDVYRMMYVTMFGELLPSAKGEMAPTRDGNGGDDITVTLMPEDATNKVGTEHTVTATVLAADGQPLIKEMVYFAVTGANEADSSAMTDENGEASFSYVGDDEGVDTITAWIDQDGNGDLDAADPQATATKTWETTTAIALVSFTASVSGADVLLNWETGAEIDNAGFNLYRATSLDGAYTQINATLIPAEGDVFAGASYSFVDTPGAGTFYYLLEDVDFSGTTTTHGPVKVEM